MGDWVLEIFERADGSMPYLNFVRALDPYRRLVLDAAVTTILGRQGHNVCNTEWGKALGAGLYEFRIRRSLAAICREGGVEPPEAVRGDQPVLLRVFFAVEAGQIVLLLSGYDKGGTPSPKRQDREIKLARALLSEHKRMSRSPAGSSRRRKD